MKKISLITLLFMFLAIEAEAQVKIGYTNPELILSSLPQVEAVDRQIESLLAEKDSLLGIRAEYYQGLISALQAQNLSDSEARAKADSIRTEFQKERQNSLNEVQQRQTALLRPIENKMLATIKSVADSLGLDLVLNEGSVNTGAFIFYASDDQINITQMVIDKLKQS